MSEHISITGEVEHWHSPQEIFAYCHRCKRENIKLTIELNQSICGFNMTARCPKCKRAIWTAPADMDELTYWHKKKDKKCDICKKPTNERDAVAFGGKFSSKKMHYWCSDKCYKKSQKEEDDALVSGEEQDE